MSVSAQSVSLQWFDEGKRASQEIEEGLHLYPFFLWNCLARSGASQYHGHAQLLLTNEPLPIHNRVAEAKSKYKSLYPSSQGYILDLFQALEEVGLALPCESSTYIASSPCPIKDMETMIMGKALDDPSFVKALLFSLRTLIDDLGVESFNVGIIMERGRVMARVVSRGKTSQTASDFGALEVIGGASIGHTDPFVCGDTLTSQLSLQCMAILEQVALPVLLDMNGSHGSLAVHAIDHDLPISVRVGFFEIAHVMVCVFLEHCIGEFFH